jgi:hypothetical protein
LSLPTLAKLGTTGEVPQTLAHARVELSRMHTCECPGRAHSTAIRATLGCMDRDADAHGKTHGRVRLAETGVGIGGTNPHLKHALELRQYPLCGREILVSPPERTTRGSNGLRTVIHTPTARPPPKNAGDCQASLKRLAERHRGSRAAPFARRPPVRACVRDIRRGHESASG